MSSRKGYPQPGSHYCLSLSRGGAVSTVRLPPAAVWAIATVALLAVAWSAALTLYVACHDDVMAAILARQAEMKAAYEDRLAEARSQFDEAASRQLLERNSIKSKVDEVLSRQARLELRGAMVVALAETETHSLSRLARREAPSPSSPDALSAIQALSPPTAAGAPRTARGNRRRARRDRGERPVPARPARSRDPKPSRRAECD